ncbi:PepSY domain-containing protein [Hellea balneolensis]|uniref:PepSY domain-containing protein n=1 Tax=Hellea balneolensis TaxID=287478 RepID=UPI0003F93582|nr:PepSY domain-containing protein [Hellea balneolensis]
MFKQCLIIVSLLCPLNALAFDNIEIQRGEVPTAALKTAEHYAPGVVFTRYAYEDENGQRIYEFEAHDMDGRHIEVDVLADGTLQEIEMEKEWDEVPIYVAMELTIEHPNFSPEFIEASIRPNGETVYEFEGIEAGLPTDYEVLDTGRSVKILAKS